MGLLLPYSRTLRPDRLLRLTICTLWGRRIPAWVVSSKWGDIGFNQPTRLSETETLPSGLKWALRCFGMSWGFICFAATFLIYVSQGLPGMYWSFQNLSDDCFFT